MVCVQPSPCTAKEAVNKTEPGKDTPARVGVPNVERPRHNTTAHLSEVPSARTQETPNTVRKHARTRSLQRDPHGPASEGQRAAVGCVCREDGPSESEGLLPSEAARGPRTVLEASQPDKTHMTRPRP